MEMVVALGLDASIDDLAINRMYYEMVNPDGTQAAKPEKKVARTGNKKKAFNPKPGHAGFVQKKTMKITEVGKKAKSRLFDYKEDHDQLE